MTLRPAAAGFLLLAIVAGCAGDQSDATRLAAECERLRDAQDFAAAVTACRHEVELGCAAYGDGAGFCGTAHLHLGMALAGTGDAKDVLFAHTEFQTAERILCTTGKRGNGSCMMAQTLAQSLRFGSRES